LPPEVKLNKAGMAHIAKTMAGYYRFPSKVMETQLEGLAAFSSMHDDLPKLIA
jgi:hypothetical protein